MQITLNRDDFEKYFFYGMENKNQVVKWIIMAVAKRLAATHKESDKPNEKSRYEQDKEAMLNLIVQLERFTSKHDEPKSDLGHKEYFYDDINTKSKEINEIFDTNAEDVNKHAALSFVKYRPVSGIYYNTYTYPQEVKEKYKKYSGDEYLEILRTDITTAWGEEVYKILCYLEELEKENAYEYYSLFLDTKYARAINRNTTEFGDEREIHEIRNVYRKFLKRNTCIRSRY